MGSLIESYREHFGEHEESRGRRLSIRFNYYNGIFSTTGDIGLAERGRVVEGFLGDRYGPATPKIPAKGKRVYYIEFHRENPEEPLGICADMDIGLRDSILSAYLNQVKRQTD